MDEQKKKFDLVTMIILLLFMLLFVGGLWVLGNTTISKIDATAIKLETKISANSNGIKSNRVYLKRIATRLDRVYNKIQNAHMEKISPTQSPQATSTVSEQEKDNSTESPSDATSDEVKKPIQAL